MDTYILQNEELQASILAKGAELVSLQDVVTKEEIMYQPEPNYWNRCSPILFPFIGGLKDGKYRYEDSEYAMSKHGFVRDMVFTCVEQKEDEVWFCLKDTPETFDSYPFHFKLFAGYRLEGRSLKVIWKVENLNEKEMHFSVGGHPAFKCPRVAGDNKEEYFIYVGDKEMMVNSLIGSDGLISKEKVEVKLEQGFLPIEEHIFDQDALVIEDHQLTQVGFAGPDKKPYVMVEFDAPVVGIWSMPGKTAPFVCVEPWYGICDATDFKGTLSERKWGNTVNAKEEWLGEYTIKFL